MIFLKLWMGIKITNTCTSQPTEPVNLQFSFPSVNFTRVPKSKITHNFFDKEIHHLIFDLNQMFIPDVLAGTVLYLTIINSTSMWTHFDGYTAEMCI